MRSIRMLREHRLLLSNFFINIHHNLDFFYKDAYRFFSVLKKKFFIYFNQKNILSLDNISKIRIHFLLNYNYSFKEYFNSKFLDIDATNNKEVLMIDKLQKTSITYFNGNVSYLFRSSSNPFNLDIFDIIFSQPSDLLESSRILPFQDISNNVREQLYYNKYEYYQFLVSRSNISYTFFKLCDAFNNNFFFGVPVSLEYYLYEDLSNDFLNTVQVSMFDIFDTNFNLFNKHVASLLIDNKVNDFKKKINFIDKSTIYNKSFKKKKSVKVYLFLIIKLTFFFFDSILRKPFYFFFKAPIFTDFNFFLHYTLYLSSNYQPHAELNDNVLFSYYPSYNFKFN